MSRMMRKKRRNVLFWLWLFWMVAVMIPVTFYPGCQEKWEQEDTPFVDKAK